MKQFCDMVCTKCGRMMSYDPYFKEYVCRQCGLTLSARMGGADRMFGHVKLEQIEEGKIYHRLFINGNKVRATAVNINVEVDCVPQCEVTICPENIEYNGQADVKYDFTPETVQQAVVVLRNELLKHGELYEGFMASIMSVLEPRERYFDDDGAFKIDTDRGAYSLALEIMSRIIGED